MSGNNFEASFCLANISLANISKASYKKKFKKYFFSDLGLLHLFSNFCNKYVDADFPGHFSKNY